MNSSAQLYSLLHYDYSLQLYKHGIHEIKTWQLTQLYANSLPFVTICPSWTSIFLIFTEASIPYIYIFARHGGYHEDLSHSVFLPD